MGLENVKKKVGRPLGHTLSEETKRKIHETHKNNREEARKELIRRKHIITITISDDMITDTIIVRDIEKKHDVSSIKKMIVEKLKQEEGA